MNPLLRCSMPVLGAILIPILFASAQSAPPPTPGAPVGRMAPYKPKNLKVLPENTDFRKVMRGYAGDLGVECEFCHTGPDPVTKRPDFSLDTNPRKEKARYMIRMTNDLNSKYLAQLPDRDEDDPISCGTCHRGEKHPSVFVAPPRPEGNRPPGAPPGAMPSAAPKPPPAN